MKNTLSELDKINSVINSQRQKYLQAIKANQRLEEVKLIYLKIKGLEGKASQLMQQPAHKPNHQQK